MPLKVILRIFPSVKPNISNPIRRQNIIFSLYSYLALLFTRNIILLLVDNVRITQFLAFEDRSRSLQITDVDNNV